MVAVRNFYVTRNIFNVAGISPPYPLTEHQAMKAYWESRGIMNHQIQ